VENRFVGESPETFPQLIFCGPAYEHGAQLFLHQPIILSTSHFINKYPPVNTRPKAFFHLHLVSDATGETLNAIAKAVTVQFTTVSPIEHAYPLVRTTRELNRVMKAIEEEPGIVLFTLVDDDLRQQLEKTCRSIGSPAIAVLDPVHAALRSYLGAESTPRIGAQHALNAEYFSRIDALNFSLIHDDGQLFEEADEADIILVGVSRTSKTPTSIYLANRGMKTANIPIVTGIPLPDTLFSATNPLIVGLVASPERIVQIRRNRLLSLNANDNTDYVDKRAVAAEIAEARRLFTRKGWPVIDVTRRSIEETAAAILNLYRERKGA